MRQSKKVRLPSRRRGTIRWVSQGERQARPWQASRSTRRTIRKLWSGKTGKTFGAAVLTGVKLACCKNDCCPCNGTAPDVPMSNSVGKGEGRSKTSRFGDSGTVKVDSDVILLSGIQECQHSTTPCNVEKN